MTIGIDDAGILRFINAVEDDARALIKEVSMLSVWGAISPDDVWEMTHLERVVLGEVIKERTEAMYGKKGFARSR